MLLINCKIHLEWSWTKNCVVSDNVSNTRFKITDTKLYASIVTLLTEENVKLTKQLNERPICWNCYKLEIKSRDLDINNSLRILIDVSCQGVKRLFLLLVTLLLIIIIPLTILITELREKATKNVFFEEQI